MGRKETPIQYNIIQWLLWHRYLVLRVNSGGATYENKDGSDRFVWFSYWSALGSIDKYSGISDVLALSPDGVFCAFEVKTPGNEATEIQEEFMEHVRQRGGVAGVVRSIDDLEQLLGV